MPATGDAFKLPVAMVAAALLAGAGPDAVAERADRQKPINVESDRMNADDIKQVAVFLGRVVVTQGTFLLCADQVTIRQDKEGNQSGTAVGNPATFREKRDNVDEWIDGEAQRIDYDNKNEVVELFSHARVNRDKDEIHGDYISYDAKTEFIKVQHDKEQAAAAPAKEDRVRAVFQPRVKPADGAPASRPAASGAAPGAGNAPPAAAGGTPPLQAAAGLAPSRTGTGVVRPAFCR
jgi:lipopolysaccharide export system protein LptA